ncbi:N-6 DNA methylase [Limosilactobacillus reuteri]|uniref:N-6 DNA methylase n=1 Tax=Limosilactobacillus reuteri TaxID=1598 RepID=UPI001E473E69|nr:N-6 DNA methylase [Limosilactobacillus reuteri]MCC4388583.1 SAM-dependent methyltransferase [Limosilactobacillus reuteri]MCC4394224.1 SAM-dependent methyltransferase [Limosilactobacillus reuteri]
MNEKIIKSADRVKSNGEVFTPNRIVKLMLAQPEIQAKIHDLSATFLEPSAGEGAFLVELLKQKMAVALSKSASAVTYNRNCLIALSSLYGIEYLEDNVEMLVMNMITTFNQSYVQDIANFDKKPNQRVLESAKVIIRANMKQGDTLKHTTSDGSPIIFSEWSSRGRMVQRTEYTFESILAQSGPTGTVQNASEQLDLFAGTDEFDDTSKSKPTKPRYAICNWVDIYKQELESES